MTKSNIKLLCERLAACEDLKDYIPFQDMMIKTPINDCLLRCLCFSPSPSGSGFHEVSAVYVPLYIPLPGFIFTYRQFILRPADLEARKWNSDWSLREENELIQSINEQADLFFSKASNASKFARIGRKICELTSNLVEQDSAFSYAQADEHIKAKIFVEVLNTKYWLQGSKEDSARLAPLKAALKGGREEVKRNLKNLVATNIELLELAGLEKFLNVSI
jgi:hypothetical protein